MSRMSISMCENDGVPSVRTIASAWAASAARSDQAISARRMTSSAPGSSKGIRRVADGLQALGIVLDPDGAQAVVGEGERERQADAAAADDGDVVAHGPHEASGRWMASMGAHEARHHHRHHRPGRVLPRRAAARQGLRGPRARAPVVLVQHRADRPPLPRSARGAGAPAAAPRRPDRLLAARAPASTRSSPTRSTTSARSRTSASPSTCPSTPPTSRAWARSACSRRSATRASRRASTRRRARRCSAPRRRRRTRRRRFTRAARTPWPRSRRTGSPSTTASPTGCTRPTGSSSTTSPSAAARRS